MPTTQTASGRRPVLLPADVLARDRGLLALGTLAVGVVGADNFAYEWLPRFPDFHDVPGQDLVLTGRNYAYSDVLGSLTDTVRSGAYVPFGTQTSPGQVVPGSAAANGAILRCNTDGTELECVAWGLRNPYGIAFDPDGRLFATEHGIDERASGSSSVIWRTSTRSTKALGTAGLTSPRESGLTTRSGATQRRVAAGSRCWPSIPTPTRRSRG